MTSKSKYSRRQARNKRKAKKEIKAKAKTADKKPLALVDRTSSVLPPVTINGADELAPLEILLMRMLSYKRPGGTKIEEAWIQEFIVKPIEAINIEITEDWMGNLYVHIGDPEKHRTLFSGHTDTVHMKEGTQSIDYDPVLGILGLAGSNYKPKPKVVTENFNTKVTKWESVWNKATQSYDTKPIEGNKTLVPLTPASTYNDESRYYSDDVYGTYGGYGSYSRGCLGADDGTGVFIMVQMILAGVEGTYVFHREEETGGQGSNHIAMTQKDQKHTRNKSTKGKWKKQDPIGVNETWSHDLDLTIYDRAIAFDRKGTTDIITDQFGACASSTFANVLASRLNHAMGIAAETRDAWKGCAGVFTDTANYVDYIPECTNLSVGYYDQHTGNETQNIPFALRLLSACKAISWDDLPVLRLVGSTSYQDVWAKWEDEGYKTGASAANNEDEFAISPYEILPVEGFSDYEEALDLVMDYPELIAQLLFEWYGEDFTGGKTIEEEGADPVG